MTRQRVQELEIEEEENIDVVEEFVDQEFGEAVDKKNWIVDKNNRERPFKCITSIQGTFCRFGPWKHRKNLNSHMKQYHGLCLPNLKVGRPVGPGSVKKKRVVNSKKMNFVVLSNPFKRARKVLWKKTQLWRKKAEISWAALQEKAQVEPSLKTCPILLSLVKNEEKLLEFLGILQIGDGTMDLQKCEYLHNNQSFANLVLHVPNSNKRVTKEIKGYFSTKNWEKNEKFRKGLTEQMFEWHQMKAILNSVSEGKDKWITKYLDLSNSLYQMEYCTRQAHIEVACDVYKKNHKEIDFECGNSSDSESSESGESIESSNSEEDDS